MLPQIIHKCLECAHLPMSSGAGKITHTSDLTSVKYLAAVKRRLREKYRVSNKY
jgi:hypothetical protein